MTKGRLLSSSRLMDLALKIGQFNAKDIDCSPELVSTSLTGWGSLGIHEIHRNLLSL